MGRMVSHVAKTSLAAPAFNVTSPMPPPGQAHVRAPAVLVTATGGDSVFTAVSSPGTNLWGNALELNHCILL